MIQSLSTHFYMLANRHYGWVGVLAGTFYLCYEVLAPIIEVVGLLTMVLSVRFHIMSGTIALLCAVSYSGLMLCTYGILMKALRDYGVENLSDSNCWKLLLLSLTELVIFHPLNSIIKIIASCSVKRNKKTWKKIQRYAQAY